MWDQKNCSILKRLRSVGRTRENLQSFIDSLLAWCLALLSLTELCHSSTTSMSHHKIHFYSWFHVGNARRQGASALDSILLRTLWNKNGNHGRSVDPMASLTPHEKLQSVSSFYRLLFAFIGQRIDEISHFLSLRDYLTVCRAHFSTFYQIEIFTWTAFWCWIQIMHSFD